MLTRKQVEGVLLERVGRLYTALGLNGSTASGANTDLNDPIGVGIRAVGGSVADPSAVADADLASVAADDYDELFDIAEYRALITALNALPAKITRQNSQAMSLVQRTVWSRVRARAAYLKGRYGFGLGELEGGVVERAFLEDLSADG